MIKAIVVDIGGVLVLGDSSNTFKKLANKLGFRAIQFFDNQQCINQIKKIIT